MIRPPPPSEGLFFFDHAQALVPVVCRLGLRYLDPGAGEYHEYHEYHIRPRASGAVLTREALSADVWALWDGALLLHPGWYLWVFLDALHHLMRPQLQHVCGLGGVRGPAVQRK